jgi:Na+/H+ antiporter NhaD/arsenite permease-like protein
MKKAILPVRIFQFYYNGFKTMEWGRELWILILIKLFIMFVVLRIFFFPRFLNQFDTTSEKEDYVSNELIYRSSTP